MTLSPVGFFSLHVQMVWGNRKFLERVLDFDGNGGVEDGQLGIVRVNDAEILLLIIPFHVL
jgi:hypothetical protein